MPDKLTAYAQLAEDTARTIMHSHETWTAFLSTAARMYKYDYNDQLMIHAQRPAATACAPYEVWNQKMSRYVRRGSRGIALLDSSGDTVSLHYVFDVADTGATRRSQPMNLWQMEQRHTRSVMDALQSAYDPAPAAGLDRQVEQIALHLSDLYWQEHRADILGIVDGSFMEGYDEPAVENCFRQAAGVSVTYTLLERCGLEPQKRFTQEDFIPVFDWNTRQAAAVLGAAVSEISGQMLRQIERTIKDFDRAHNAERMEKYERDDLQTQRGLSDSESKPKFAGASAAGEIRQDAQDLPEGASPGFVEPSAADREAGQPSEGDRPHGEQPLGADDGRAGEAAGRDRELKGAQPDGMDAADERAESAGGRSAADGAGVQLNFLDASEESLFLSEAKQISMAESVVSTPFAFSFSQEEMDHVLRLGGNADGGRKAIAAFFMKEKSLEEQARFLQSAFSGGNGIRTDLRSIAAWYAEDGIHLASGESARYAHHAQILSWQDAASRIQELLDSGQFAASVELAEAPGYERKRIAEGIWHLKQDFSAAANEQGFLYSAERTASGFAQDTEHLASQMANSPFAAALAEEMQRFAAAYSADRSLLRFHHHRPVELLARLNDLSLPQREYAAQMTDIPWANEFITQDEADAALSSGSSVADGRNRIYTFFIQPHTSKEQAGFLKNEYGIGGRSPALPGNTESWISYDGKGIKLQKKGCPGVKLNWNQVAKRIDDLIRHGRYFTPEALEKYEAKKAAKVQEKARKTAEEAGEQHQETISSPPAFLDYNAIKHDHQDDIVLYQVGDSFEMYGEDAKAAAEKLDLHLATRPIPGAGHVDMCGIPAHALEQHVERLRKSYGVIIAATQDGSAERKIYSLAATGREAVQTASKPELTKPAVKELFEQYKLSIGNALVGDTRYINACRSSDRENAYIEGAAAIQRIVTESGDLQLTKLYFDMPTFHNRLHQELLAETYPALAATVTPSPYKVTPADIDAALQRWNENIESKRAVVRYMKEHGREKDTAAWLAQEYGMDNAALPLKISVGNSEIAVLSWAKVQQRIAQLIKEDKFYTEAEYDRLDDVDPIAIRENLAQRGIVNGEVVEPEKLNNAPFIRQVMNDVEQITVEEKAMDAPDRYSTRQLPYKGSITGIGDNESEQKDLPYGIVVERIRVEEPQHTPPAHSTPSDRESNLDEVLDGSPVSVRIANERKAFTDAVAAEKAMYGESKSEIRRNMQNFRITDDNLGVGGTKAKYQANINAIKLLKSLEAEGRQAIPEQQEVLSRYVGWGGLPEAFDKNNAAWTDEFQALRSVLSQDEYEAARASTLNAHYTSPTVIRAIYEAVGNMGFTTGNILEPSMGIGNFFGLLPEGMQGSRLYGVELDSITGRIAKQLYPKAHITVAGFETTDRKDFFDLAVGNVPFGNYQVNDRAYNKLGFSIHNYFFAKALDQVRPGGVVAFVTSRYTLDQQSPEVRKYLAQRAELLGAIRLPNNAFKANAGTEVVSDIIFLQKRDRPIEIEPDWIHLGTDENGFAINSYFIEHPDMMLGQPTTENTQYGRQDFTLLPIEGANLADQLHEAVQHIGGAYQEAELPELGEGEAIDTSIPADPNVKNYSYAVVDGNVYYRENSRMVRPDLNATAKERVKGLVALRECVHALIDEQLNEYGDDAIEARQAELNTLYDAYTAKYGLINDRANRLAFSDDSSYYLLCSLEVLDDEQKLKRKADIFTKRTIRQQRVIDHADTASEALAVSISEHARVDLPYMAQLTGKDEETLASDLSGVIFRLPGTAAQYVTADEYLSGNVRQKLREATLAAESNPAFSPNVAALEAAQPKDLEASEIDVRLGATWISKDYVQDFMYELLATPAYMRRAISVQYSPYTAEWNVTGKSAVASSNVAAHVTYGTQRASAYRILEDTLNLRDVRIYDTVQDAAGKERRVLNPKETMLAQQKQQAIRDAFGEWIWKDAVRRQTLVSQYNEQFNAIRPREYDGQHITFVGMNPEISLREHQRNAVAHILYGGNTLLAHQVGAGKTFEMVAAAMESKRLGLCQKSMFVVPNHLTEQWASEFLRLYPSAQILVTTKKDFEKHNRKKFCARIATGDYDAIIIGHSQFERIPISAERQERILRDQIDSVMEGIHELKRDHSEQFSIKQLERTRKQLEARLQKLQAEEKKDDVVTFEQLGVDRLYVDEAHSHKNLFLATKMRNVAGLSTSDAQKSSDMFAKCRYMDELTGGRGIVFATGTPVSNSMTELYTMQRYLQYSALKRSNMTHFDCWASTFGETTTAIELAPEGTGYRARTRFAKFFNLPELMTLFKEVADIKTADQLHLPTPEAHYETVVVKPTEHQKAMVQALSERAAAVHSGNVDPSVDNMLKITSDGRKLGLDQRLINPLLPDDPASKVNACVANIHRIWRDGQAERLTQLVFCDISTPKGTKGQDAAEFNVYDDIRSKLIAMGIPKEEIAFIHTADTEVKKKELFAKVRSGQVRVLMGSTAKMGAGTNCQDRLIALHDLDCPWRPGDLEQRAGRIVRQGNQNKDVHIYRYVTESTFDAYLWQTVENKQRFISQIMTSKSPVRSCEDVDETALSYAEIKALCAGDDRIREKMDLDVDVARLKLLKADHQSKQYRLEDQLLRYFPREIERYNGFISGFQQDIQTLAAHPLPEKAFIGMELRGKFFTDREKAGEAILSACKDAAAGKTMPLGSYRGFAMQLDFEAFGKQHILTLRGEMSHRVELGTDARGNLTRIDNALHGIEKRMNDAKAQLDNLHRQMEAAKAEVGKPFPQADELRRKSARLAELDASLNMENHSSAEQEISAEHTDRPSVHSALNVPCKAGSATHRSAHEEER